MNILVTGGAGYLGSTLVPRLLASGHAVTVIDQMMYQQASLLDCCAHPKFDFVRGDVRDERVMKPLVAAHDLIIPLACLTGAPICAQMPNEAESTNLQSIITLLEKLRSPSQAIVYPTTNSGYGVGQSDQFCDETTPLNPISAYGRQKVEAERRILESGNSVTLRLATVFGMSPRMRLDLLVNDFTYKAVVDGYLVLFESHFKRNYIHVRDVARAFLHAIDHFDAMNGQCYNVGLSSANLSKWELCEHIKEILPRFVFVESEINSDPDKRDYIVSNDKIEATGFRPEHSLSDGIKELVKGYQILRGRHYSNV